MEQLTKEELILINNALLTAKIFSLIEAENQIKPLINKLKEMIEGEKPVDGEVVEETSSL